MAHGVDGEVGEEEHDRDHERRSGCEYVAEEPAEGSMNLAVDAEHNLPQAVVTDERAAPQLKRVALELADDEDQRGERLLDRACRGLTGFPNPAFRLPPLLPLQDPEREGEIDAGGVALYADRPGEDLSSSFLHPVGGLRTNPKPRRRSSRPRCRGRQSRGELRR